MIKMKLAMSVLTKPSLFIVFNDDFLEKMSLLENSNFNIKPAHLLDSHAHLS